MSGDFMIINGKEVIAESLAYRLMERALQAFIDDPEMGDEEIKLADGFLCTLREAKKTALKNLDKKGKVKE